MSRRGRIGDVAGVGQLRIVDNTPDTRARTRPTSRLARETSVSDVLNLLCNFFMYTFLVAFCVECRSILLFSRKFVQKFE